MYSRQLKILTNILTSIILLFSAGAQSAKLEEGLVKKQQPVKLDIRSYDWHGKIPQSRLVILKNLYGEIRSRNHSDPEIFLHASYQLIGDTPLKPEFKIIEGPDRLMIEVVYSEPLLDKNSQLRGRTDVSILFPDDVSIYAETDSGMIKIDKTASHVEAVTQSGDIKLTTTGLFKVKTDSGTIALRLRGQKQMGESTAVSVSGTIKADIFNDMGLYLVNKTAGEITLNDQLQENEFILQQANNLSAMRFQSDSGNIHLNVIEPPDLEHSVKPSNVTSVDVDLRDLKKAKLWKPGDPIFEINEKRDNSNKKSENDLD